MKTTLSKILILFLMIPVMGYSIGDPMKGKFTKTKKVSKSYNVSSSATVLVDNSYGNIEVTSWNQNRVEIEVFIKTNGNDEERVQKALDAINIEFSGTSTRVSAKTLFEESSSWWNVFSSNSNVNREINYVVKLPVTNDVDLSNDYGNININQLKGNAKINCDYGKLIIGELLGENNLLNFDYTKNSTIGYMKRGKISADYSGFEIEEAGALELQADYTSSHINKVTNMSFNCDYGSLYVGKARQLQGNGDYLGTKIGEVYGKLVLNLDYGSASIERLTPETTQVQITSDYTGLKIGYDKELAFSYHIKTSYGSVKGLEGLQETSSDESSYTGTYQGYNLSSNSNNKLQINTSYGSIKFERK